MQKRKENLFLEKFSLLNSQKHTEDINWSSSSSSDYENTSCTVNNSNLNRPRNQKRKRKTKYPKNISSNLDITITDASKDRKNNLHREKSPIFVTKCMEIPGSPILVSRPVPNKYSSPILHNKSLHQKSPILMLNSPSPKYSAKVRKKLSYNEQKKCKHQNTEEIINSNRGNNERSQVEKNVNLFYLKNEIKSNVSLENHSSVDDTLNSIEILENSQSVLSAKLNLMKNVKNYFNSHFSSENTSQNISDTPTPEESIKHEEIEILSCKTQIIPSIQQTKHEITSNSDSSNCMEKNTKKIKYKKGGLAHRLNVLLKKQNAHVSLWQHERFLAGNSNFVIPNGEHVVFYIKKIDFRYGGHLLDVVDVKYEKFVIFINSLNVNINIREESVFKLYEPYRILELDNNYKIIVNVCKFECIDLK